MVNRKKKYLGTLNSEELAAKFYDKVAIQYQGVKAKTNFMYNKQQIIEVLKLQPLLSEVDFGLGPCQQADAFGDEFELWVKFIAGFICTYIYTLIIKESLQFIKKFINLYNSNRFPDIRESLIIA